MIDATQFKILARHVLPMALREMSENELFEACETLATAVANECERRAIAPVNLEIGNEGTHRETFSISVYASPIKVLPS